MSVIHDAIEPLDGYLLTMTRDTQKGGYFIEFGIPKKWVIKSTKLIKVDKVVENPDGILYKISAVNENTPVDDLFDFAKLVIDTNHEIEKKEEEFKENINEVKKELEDKISKFYKELEVMKEISFGKFDEVDISGTTSTTNIVKTVTKPEKKKRGRKPKIKLPDNDDE